MTHEGTGKGWARDGLLAAPAPGMLLRRPSGHGAGMQAPHLGAVRAYCSAGTRVQRPPAREDGPGGSAALPNPAAPPLGARAPRFTSGLTVTSSPSSPAVSPGHEP